MDFNSQFELFKCLENLTFFPKLDICKQLEEHALFLVSFLSEKLEELVKNHCEKKTEKSVWEITLSKNILIIYLKFEDEKKNFQIGFKEDQNSSEDFYFEHDKRWNSYTFFYKTTHHLEKASFKALQLLSHLFPPSRYQRITVPLGPRCPDFPFRFLSKLPHGISKFVDLQADQEVECVDLMTFLRNVRRDPPVYETFHLQENIRSRLDIKLRIKKLAPCDEIAIRHRDLKIADARFLTHESIQKLDVVTAEIGENNFTSKDFNAFLRAWMERKEVNRTDKVAFDIREDQKIKIEEVLDGLNAHFGKPRITDRWRLKFHYVCHGWLCPKAIDCDQGWTIKNSEGTLATVLLEPNRLSLFSDRYSCTLAVYIRRNEIWIGHYNEDIRNTKDRQRKLERKIALQGLNARAKDLKKLVRLAEKMEEHTTHLETALELQEKLKYWNND